MSESTPDPSGDWEWAGWSRSVFTAAGLSHPVYRSGTGPGVVLLPELPGLNPAGIRLAERLVADGFTVAVPSLFGVPGRSPSGAQAARTIASVCISREFRAFAHRAHRPVAEYVRALARSLHADVGGPGVGVIGMCFTGGFALAAAVEPAVLAPVASQPSVPFPLGGSRRRDPGMSEEEIDEVARRAREDGLCAIGLRFSADPAVPSARFAALAERLGPGWRVVEIDSGPGNPHGLAKSAHSVLTDPGTDRAGTPTAAALDEVLTFLHQRLAG
jgi:dienelactone hydrolase